MGLQVHQERNEPRPVAASSLRSGQIARALRNTASEVYIKTDESTVVHLDTGLQYSESDFDGIEFFPVTPGTTFIVT